MSIVLNIPTVAEETLHEAWGPILDRVVLEALAIEGYRTGKLSAAEVGRLVGLEDRWAVEQWLAERDVPLNYTLSDLDADRKALDRLLGPVPG